MVLQGERPALHLRERLGSGGTAAIHDLPRNRTQRTWRTIRAFDDAVEREEATGRRVCDSFAAELLLPKRLFQPLAEKSAVSLASVDALAERFVASTMATGSRYAEVISTPCAFVISENGKIRYASRSKPLIDGGAWIRPGEDVPRGTVSKRAIEGAATPREEVPADEWFSDWERGGTLIEEARHLPRWNRTLSLLWFESEEVPPPVRDRDRSRWEIEGREIDEYRDDEEDGLEELGDNLRWPGSRRRR